MNPFDEELQNKIESESEPKPIAGKDPDELAYRAVFRIASKNPKNQLPPSFAEKVLNKIVLKKKREARRDMIWLGFGVFFLLVGLITTAVLAGLTMELGFLRDISAYTGIFVFGAAIIVAFNVLEKKILTRIR